MKSIKNSVETSNIINKSEFINYLIPVSSVGDAKSELDNIRKIYPDANHHCYAYIIGKNQEIQKYSDDGEPSKTAGMPMIEVLKKHDVTNVFTVTVRYFGGIKLGAGGLVRAYTKSVSESIKECEFSHLVKFSKVEVSIPFDEIGHVEKYIRDTVTLLDTTYDNLVHYFVEFESSMFDSFNVSIVDKTKGKAVIKLLEEVERYK